MTRRTRNDQVSLAELRTVKRADILQDKLSRITCAVVVPLNVKPDHVPALGE